MTHQRKRIAIIGGLGALGAADLFFKLVQATPSTTGRDQYELMFEQRPFDEPVSAGSSDARLTARKLYVFDMVRHFERRGADLVLLPCFISHTFLDEIADEVSVPLLDLRKALVAHLRLHHPQLRRIGVLTSDRVRRHGLLDRAFGDAGWSVVHPADEGRQAAVMAAIYGDSGLKSGHLQGEAIDLLERACRGLLGEGAELIVPGFTEIPIVVEALRRRGLPVVDSNRAYAEFAVASRSPMPRKPFKLGVVGGVGPAATADFMQKVVRNTKATRDQDHIKMLVEQNPQIPDRTAHLVGDGADPTVALYAACRKLQAGDADLIAIPCNTAHAFVERIQPYLAIPIVNMLHETVRHLRERHPAVRRVGLLATSGTVESRVYHEALESAGLEPLVPDGAHQALVTAAIYGESGVKAGFTDGECHDQLSAALAHLARRGAQAVILGCTELPLLLPRSASYPVADTSVVLLDPTDILARRCVDMSQTVDLPTVRVAAQEDE